MTVENEDEVEVTRCESCNTEVDDEFRTINGLTYCEGCSVECRRCSAFVLAEDAIRSAMWPGDAHCRDCCRECENCVDIFPRDEIYRVRLDGRPVWRCAGCSMDCEGCDDRIPYSDWEYYCPLCQADRERGGNGIDDYGHTTAQMWLGGPVKALGGYYIGFELEISAEGERYQGISVRQWANENIAEGSMDCKEDSSVAGFEIVSQPMTPAFFESIDWESFFTMLNSEYPINGPEPTTHGLHVHIGRAAFQQDDVMVAAYSYLLSQGEHLDHIARREPYHYCEKVAKPVSATISASPRLQGTKQGAKIRRMGIYAGRNAINLNNNATIEIRAFRSTRSADELRDAVRVTYLAAEYVRHLRSSGSSMSAKALQWSSFARWVGINYPFAFTGIAGWSGEQKAPNRATPEQVASLSRKYEGNAVDGIETPQHKPSRRERIAAAVPLNPPRSAPRPRDSRGRFAPQLTWETVLMGDLEASLMAEMVLPRCGDAGCTACLGAPASVVRRYMTNGTIDWDDWPMFRPFATGGELENVGRRIIEERQANDRVVRQASDAFGRVDIPPLPAAMTWEATLMSTPPTDADWGGLPF